MTKAIVANLSAERIANGLPKGRRIKQDEYRACCPAHDDNTPSLSITQRADTVLVHCWSGCGQMEVIEALRSLGLWHSKKHRQKPQRLTRDEIEYIEIWITTYRDNVRKGYKPTYNEQQKQKRYIRALSEIANA